MKRRDFIKSGIAGISLSLTPGWLFASKQELPNVLLIGDSISMGYTPFGQELLKGKANVYRPLLKDGKPENCGGSTFGVSRIDQWIDGKKWAVIHFNFGLHDLKHVNPVTGAASIKAEDPVQADIEKYKENLKIITDKLKATGAKLIWATTTPVPPKTKSPLREPEMVLKYNKAALGIMKRKNVSVDDLYASVLPRIADLQLPNNVHFNEKGYKFLGEEVANSIAKML